MKNYYFHYASNNAKITFIMQVIIQKTFILQVKISGH